MKYRKTIITILTILIISILFIVLFAKIYTSNKPNNNTTPPKENKDIKYEDTSTFSKELVLCKIDRYNIVEYTNDCQEEKLTIKTKSNNTKFFFEQSYIGDNDYLVYTDDNIIKIYDLTEKKSINTNLSINNYNPTELLVTDKVVKGLTLLNIKNEDTKYAEYYSFKQNKLLYENKYATTDNFSTLFGNYIYTYVAENNYYKLYILDTEKEKVLLELKDYFDSNDSYINHVNKINDNYVNIYYSENENIHTLLYNSKMQKVDENFDDYSFSDKDGIMILKGNIVYVYDNNSKIIKKIDKYNNILDIIDNKIVLTENERIVLVDLDGNKTNTDIPFTSIDHLQFASDNIYDDNKTIIFVIKTKVNDIDKYIKEYEKLGDNMYTAKQIKKCDLAYEYIYTKDTKETTKIPYPLCN